MEELVFLTVEQVKDIFQQSNLPIGDLSQIWTLSDYNNDGKLTEKEFTVAKFLIYARMTKQNLPDKLPEALYSFLVSSQSLSDIPTTALGSQSGYRNIPASALGSQGSSAGKDKWVISPQQLMKYKEHFDHQVKDETGGVSGTTASALFKQSNLSNDVLGQIWTLADVNQDGNLNEQEFAIAMHLIHYKMAGGEVPSQLPPSLLASVKLGPSTAIIAAPPQPALVIPEIHLPDITISVTIPSMPQLDISPINPYPLSELSDKFGISDIIMTAYDPNIDIQRTQSEVQTSAVAQSVLDQAEPELKNLNLKLESLSVLQRTLQDKSVALSNQLSLADSQRVQILTLVQDYHNQIEQVEHELQHQYQDLVQLKNNLESYSSMGVGDVNSLRMLRNQLTQEQTELTTQLDAIREEKTRTLAELDLTRKEVERICAETAQMPDTSSITRSMATMSLFNQPENLLGPTVNMNTLPQYSSFVDPRHGLPGYTGVTVAQLPEEQETEIKNRERRVDPKKATDKKSRDKTSSGPANDKIKKDKAKKKKKK
jgi:hypothetical protein